MTDDTIKRCLRCKTSYTRQAWEALPLKGVMSLSPGEEIELRNCPCGTTLAIDKRATEP